MKKLTIKLKQHTPMIHFQHDQEGATLRASEVKPKLDRFILTKLGQGNYEAGVKKAKECKWLIGKEGHYALNYKMRIEGKNKKDTIHLDVFSNAKKGKTVYQTDQFPFLLANMGGKENEEELMNLSLYDSVELVLSIPEEGLFDEIDKTIEQFFAIHNFGQRQTKGFGSFSVFSRQIDDEETQKVSWDFKNYFINGTPLMKFQLNSNNDLKRQQTLFSVIDFYWRCLKSGVNYTKRIVPRNGMGNVQIRCKERYIKSFLWKYLSNKDLTWEKRKLKNAFQLETSFPERKYSDYSYTPSFARGLMGCPDKFEYRIPQNEFYERNGRFKEEVVTETIEIENVSKKVDRISSPIYFKPYIFENQVTVYILFDEQLINELKELKKDEREYKFICGKKEITIPLNPESISYIDLVKKYHLALFTDDDYIRSTFGEYKNNQWIPAKISISKNQEGRTIRKWGNMDISWKMVPRDFNWNNILDPNDNGQLKYVSFAQIIK